MDWTNDAIFEFLSLYEDEPALWNTKSVHHKNRTDQQNAWSRIQNKLKEGILGHVSVKEIKKKRDNLMSTYRKLRCRIEESMKAGSGADEIFKPDWPFYNAMSTFLDDVYIPRKRKNSDDFEEKDFTEDDNENSNAENDEKEQKNEGSERAFKSQQKLSKRPKTNETEKQMDEAINYLKRMAQRTEQDECSLYTELLCKKLRGLQEKTRDIAMIEIDKLIFHLKQNETQIQLSPAQIPSGSLYQSQSLNYQHGYEFQHPQPSPDMQIYKYSKPSPTFQLTPSPQASPVLQLTPSPTFHPTASSPSPH